MGISNLERNCIVGARSRFLRAKFESGMRDCKETIIDVDQSISPEGVQRGSALPVYFMRQYYSSARRSRHHLLAASDLLGIERLKVICEVHMSKALFDDGIDVAAKNVAYMLMATITIG